MPVNENTLSRSGWAKLNWQDAQIQIGSLLHDFHFTKFEELKISKSKRADIVVCKHTDAEVVTGIIEVKSYRTITPKIVENAIIQACGYLREYYTKIESNNRWKNKTKRYFVSAVFTKDYPSIFSSQDVLDYANYLPTRLLEENRIDLFTSVPENLISNMKRRNLVHAKQGTISDYFFTPEYQ